MAIQARQQLYAALEATYNADPAQAATDAFIAVDDLSIEVASEDAEIEPIDAFLDGLGHVAGQLLYKLSFSTPLKGSGTLGTVPDIGQLFKGCGFDETVVAMTSVTYQPASVFGAGATGYQSLKFFIEDATHQFQIQGSYGTFSISADPATYPKVRWEFTGLYERPVDDAAILAPTVETSRPQPSRGLTLTIHGTAGGASLRPSSVELALNREVHVTRSMAATFGVAAIELGRCVPTLTAKVQEQTIAGKDWWLALEDATLSTLSLRWAGAAGNIVTITDAAGTGGIAVRTLGRGEDNGVTSLDLGFSFRRSAGDDQLSIAFT